MHLALRAFRTSPIQSLYTEAGEPYLQNRRLALQYTVKLKAKLSNLACTPVFQPECSYMYEARPKAVKPFGIWVKPYLENLNIKLDSIRQYHFWPVPH